jgi:hypothetical protein
MASPLSTRFSNARTMFSSTPSTAIGKHASFWYSTAASSSSRHHATARTARDSALPGFHSTISTVGSMPISPRCIGFPSPEWKHFRRRPAA